MKFLLSCVCVCALLATRAGAQVDEKPYYPLDPAKYGLTLPTTEDEELNRLLRSPNTTFYKIRQAWQHYIPGTLDQAGIDRHPLIWTVYRRGVFGELNSNVKFPWETTVGLNSAFKDKDEAYQTVDFFNLPEKEGVVRPILIINEAPVKWIFPAETTVGEILYVEHDKQRYIQEIRTRTKNEASTTWEPRVYRPIRNRQELVRLANLPRDLEKAKEYMYFRNPQEDEVFKMEGQVERLPRLTETTVKRLLALPFKDVTDEEWSPSSDQAFSILPKHYCFGLLSVDSVSCANCHRQTQITTHNLIPREPLIRRNPDKDTSIRGCDAVFSWHPFAASGVKDNVGEDRTLLFRDYDMDRRLIRIARAGVTVPGYKLTRFVEDSLKSYELPQNRDYLHHPDVEETARPNERKPAKDRLTKKD